MAETLRPYQQGGIEQVHGHWRTGTRRVLFVLPTGGGKTVVASAVCHHELAEGGSVLFVVHRTELLTQAAERFAARFGHLDVGIVAPGVDAQPHARIQVGTVQTLLARGVRPDVSLVIFDEAHHYAAKDWAELFAHYSNAKLLGLTATPERQDGKPLGDLFDALVVGAKYSELLRDGFLTPCAVYQPPHAMEGDFAQDPLVAYQRYAEGSQAFVFCTSVEAAETLATRFNEAGIVARCIEAKTPKDMRKARIAAFRRGELRVITNVNTMTEGVDVPQARTVILVRPFRHVGAFLQAGGRVLRPHESKPHALIIDLVGATLVHGFPTDDREYSLDGEGIKRAGTPPLTICGSCHRGYPSRPGGCPFCGYVAPEQEKILPKIWDLELKAVFAGELTPLDAKAREYKRLRELGRKRGWALYAVQKEYQKLFAELPKITDATEEEQRAEFERLTNLQKAKGYSPKYVTKNFYLMFGTWPPKGWAA